MPRVIAISPQLRAVQEFQDWVVTRQQALEQGLTRHAIAHRLRPDAWQVLLPSVYLCHPGEPSRRQLLIGAQLYAGEHAAIDGADACRHCGLTSAAVDEQLVGVVVPWGSPVRTCGYVRVRRTTRPMRTLTVGPTRYLLPPDAVVAACRRMRTERSVMALLSEAVQRGRATPLELLSAHARGSHRNAAMTGRALENLFAGIRSAPEADARAILESSHLLPRPIYNCLLRLPCGRHISPDALIADAGLVHETNGRRWHEREDLFAAMQERHDVMTAAGLTVLHNAPSRLMRSGPDVLAEMERCYARLAGRGLPPGVEIVRLAN